MDIHFVSSLAEEDEVRLAGALLGAISSFLEHYPIAYSIRVHTSDGKMLQHDHGTDRPRLERSPAGAPRHTRSSSL